MNECDEKHETIADIVTGLRQSADSAFPYDVDAMNIYDSLADRIEAAWRREKAEAEADALAVGGIVETARHTPGNAAALRDAVVKALTLINVCDWPPGVSLDGVGEVIREIDSVLDKPPRQCDVGTADEKYQRWVHFCEQRLHSCHNCECKSPVGCTFKFGDMPYAEEEGGAE